MLAEIGRDSARFVRMVQIMLKVSPRRITLKDIERAIMLSEGSVKDKLIEIYIKKTLFALKVNDPIKPIIKSYKAYNHVVDILEKFNLSQRMRDKLKELAYHLMIKAIEYYKMTKNCKESVLAIQFALRVAHLSQSPDIIMKSLYNAGVMMISCGMKAIGKEYIERAKKYKKELK